MSSLQDISEALAAVVESVGPAVARVELGCGAASAIAWDTPGVFVTSAHGLGDHGDVSIALGDGRTATAKVVGHDRGTDVAVLRADDLGAVPVRWTDTTEARVGHVVLALGRPGRTVRATFGLVSALGDGYRTMAGGTVDRYVEVDGSLHRGFTGGPLVDAQGRVLGMNTSRLQRGGATVPTETLRRIVPELLAGGSARRGVLGVEVVPGRVPEALAATLGQSRGLLVAALQPDGPAARGGLHVGDLLLAIDGLATTHPGELAAALGRRSGVEVTLKLVRVGAPLELRLVTG